jgi:hypothetical protein
VYEISDTSMAIRFPSRAVLSTREINFRLRDIANGYTMNCTWGPVDGVYEIFWYFSKCTPEGDPNVDVFTDRFLLRASSEGIPTKNVSISQVWVCDSIAGSYPYVGQE